MTEPDASNLNDSGWSFEARLPVHRFTASVVESVLWSLEHAKYLGYSVFVVSLAARYFRTNEYDPETNLGGFFLGNNTLNVAAVLKSLRPGRVRPESGATSVSM